LFADHAICGPAREKVKLDVRNLFAIRALLALFQEIVGAKYFGRVRQFVLHLDFAHGDPFVATGYPDTKTI
jgi:hypothetical protein